MSEVTDPLAWVMRAEEDYAIATASLRRKRTWTYGACFHAQQCAEKDLKAMLVARGQPFPKHCYIFDRKYSIVRPNPSSRGTTGCHPRSDRARAMSGRRCLGSSAGSGR